MAHLFRSLTSVHDERFCLSFYEEATLAEKKVDSLYLNQIINELAAYAHASGLDLQDKLDLLNEKLETMSNSRIHFIGTWISDKQLTINNPYPEYIIYMYRDSTHNFHISTHLCSKISKKLFKKSIDKVESNFIVDVSKDMLYSNWSSEHLKVGNADLSTLLRTNVRDLGATINGHYARRNEHSRSEQVAAGLLTEMGSVLINTLFDNLAVSKKKIYLYEQSMALMHPNIMTVDVKGMRLRMNSSNLNYVDKHEYAEKINFLRLDNKSNMPITENQLFISKKAIKGIQDDNLRQIYKMSRKFMQVETILAVVTGASLGLGFGSFGFKPVGDLGFKGYKKMAFSCLGIGAVGLGSAILVGSKMLKKLNKKILRYNEQKLQGLRKKAALTIVPASENIGLSLQF